MSSLLVVGFLLGVRHALDPDHIASVATISSGSRSLRDGLNQGAAWGVGHTLTLLLFGGSALLLGLVVPGDLALVLELTVGLMLILLGADVVRRIIRERIHVHRHDHADVASHLHVHSHAQSDRHEHSHPPLLPLRALFVGLMHGLAGSAALILLTVVSAPSISAGIIYILVFGVGSILGMGLLSVIIALPLSLSSNR
ncbi:MAG: urease accessory protein, partial [Chloroflexi bacterium]|nr:urease accessory protein [Chloroflexota bacterium]